MNLLLIIGAVAPGHPGAPGLLELAVVYSLEVEVVDMQGRVLQVQLKTFTENWVWGISTCRY